VSESSPTSARGGALGGGALACASLWCFSALGATRWIGIVALVAAALALVLTFRARRRRDDYVTTAALVIALVALGLELAVVGLARV
jgi:hypothetical protein